MLSSERIAAHLQETYGGPVGTVSVLTPGTFKVARPDAPAWVARVYPPQRPLTVLGAEAQLLRTLERRGFPAERCAAAEPVSTCDGYPVMVTKFVEGTQANGRGRTWVYLGALLGRLHSRPGDELPAAGAWHHVTPTGTPADEVRTVQTMLDEAVARVGVRELASFDRVREAVDRTDGCEDLPHSVVHPDAVPVNAITTPQNGRVLVDWAGAGRGPRLWSLGMSLFAGAATSHRVIPLFLSRYLRHVRLEPEELERLEPAVRARPLMIEAWCYCKGWRGLAETVARIEDLNLIARRGAAQARQVMLDGSR